MRVEYEKEGARERIIKIVTALAPEAQWENIDILYQSALCSCLALCGRNDVPQLMENAIALVLCGMVKEGSAKPVLSLKRGDVSVTYATGSVWDIKNALAPFIRLKSV